MKNESQVMCIGDRVTPGFYAFHSRFERVVNFLGNRKMVSVVTEGIGPGPGNVVMDPAGFGDASSLVVGEDFISWTGREGETRLSTVGVPRFCSAIDSWFGPLLPFDFRRFSSNLLHFERVLLEHAPQHSLIFLLKSKSTGSVGPGFEGALVRRFESALDRILNGEVRAGAAALHGLGRGLTPSGDDFTAGLFMARHLLQAIGQSGSGGFIDRDWVVRLSETELGSEGERPSLSSVFLEYASRGCLCERWKRLSSNLVAGCESGVEDATRGVLEIGSSSGADTAVGFLIAVKRGFHVC